MLAQVAQVLYFNGTLPLRANQSGWLSQNFSHMIRALRSTITGNADNEYTRRGRHRRRLSKNTWTLHCPYQRARTRLHTLVPHT